MQLRTSRKEVGRVYLCLCNALTDQHLADALADPATRRTSDVYAACGCRAQCGGCVKTVVGLLRDKLALADTMLVGAD